MRRCCSITFFLTKCLSLVLSSRPRVPDTVHLGAALCLRGDILQSSRFPSHVQLLPNERQMRGGAAVASVSFYLLSTSEQRAGGVPTPTCPTVTTQSASTQSASTQRRSRSGVHAASPETRPNHQSERMNLFGQSCVTLLLCFLWPVQECCPAVTRSSDTGPDHEIR